MKINKGKTNTLVILTKPSDYKWDPEFVLNGKKVEPKKEMNIHSWESKSTMGSDS